MENAIKTLKRGERRKTRIESVFEFLLYFFVFFPYIAFTDTSTDLQLYCLVAATLFVGYRILKNKLAIPNESLYLIAAAGVAALIALTDLNFGALRGLANYLSLAIICLAVYNCIRFYGLNEKYCKIFILIWFFVGAVQLFIKKDFLSFLLASSRTTDGRGVFGLANEPSFYGITMSFAMLVAVHFKKRRQLYMCLAAIQVVLFAQSAMGIIVMCIILVMCFMGEIKITKRTLCIILIGLIIAILITAGYCVLFPEKRISQLIIKLFTGKILEDASVSLRLSAIIDSFRTFFSNYGLPSGFGERIMSGFGAILVELGVFALPIIFVVCKSVTYVFKYKKLRIVNFILFFAIMLTAIQLAHPMIAFCVGMGMENEKRKRAVYCRNLMNCTKNNFNAERKTVRQ